MRDTRTGITKKDFWPMYAKAKDEAYTFQNIKSAWRATGLHPFNPNKVILPLEEKHKKKLSKSHSSTSTTPRTFLCYKTPQNRRELRHQTQVAIDLLRRGNQSSDSAIALLRRMHHQTETAFTLAELANMERDDIKKRFGGRKAPKTTRQKLTQAQLGDANFLKKLEIAAVEKEQDLEEKKRLREEKAVAIAEKKVCTPLLYPSLQYIYH